MNNDNDLNLHLHDQMWGWLRYRVPIEDKLQSLEIHEAEDTPKIKSLGVLWEAMADVFTFSVQTQDVSTKPTKRNVLSTIATVFDPLQFLAYFSIRAKVLMQEVWLAEIGWDDNPSDDLTSTKWRRCVSEFHKLSHITIP